MLHKTKGIILHQIKYTDSGIIVQAYTRDFGRSVHFDKRDAKQKIR